MGGCQSYGPFLGNYPRYYVPYYNRDHNFDNHPYSIMNVRGSGFYIVKPSAVGRISYFLKDLGP